jgi:hypothetical protein
MRMPADAGLFGLLAPYARGLRSTRIYINVLLDAGAALLGIAPSDLGL